MTEAESFPIIALDPEWVLDDAAMGSKDKKWFMLPSGERWLFKFSRVNEGVPTDEHWAEKLAAEVAAQLELPHAKVELSKFNRLLAPMIAQSQLLRRPIPNFSRTLDLLLPRLLSQ